MGMMYVSNFDWKRMAEALQPNLYHPLDRCLLSAARSVFIYFFSCNNEFMTDGM